MDPSWWGIVVVVVLGSALVWFGWWSDRRRAIAADREARTPPGEAPGADHRPAYVTQDDVHATPLDLSATSADADLIARKDAAATLPAGAASGAFLNRPDLGLAVVPRPSVLVLVGRLDSDRDVTTVLLGAGKRGPALVVVAPGFSATALATLQANLKLGRVRCLPIELEDAAARRRAVALTGGLLVDAADLASGWLPDPVWGRCDGWLADLDDSWTLVSGRDGDEA